MEHQACRNIFSSTSIYHSTIRLNESATDLGVKYAFTQLALRRLKAGPCLIDTCKAESGQ